MEVPPLFTIAPWLWLLEQEVGGVALDASATKGHLASELSEHFQDVRVLRDSEAALDEVRDHGERAGDRPYTLQLGSLHSLPFTEGTLDCIALHDRLVDENVSRTETLQILERLRRLLKAGGWLVAASPNPACLGSRPADGVGIDPRAFSRMLGKAGFNDIRRLFVTPALDRAHTLIPDTRRPINAYEAFDSIQGATSLTRRAVAAVGSGTLLYPAYFIMASA